jgi:DNA polymerase-3 subunit epsilon
VLLFQRLLLAEGAVPVFKSFLNARSQEATFPPSLPKSIFERLPRVPGIYYFKNQKGGIIYIGKAINIRKRVLGHFYDKSNREVQMCRETADIDFEISGNEIIALLMESAAIKKHFPLYNRAQKRKVTRYGIFSYEDRQGIVHLAFNNVSLVPQHLISFSSTTDCRLYLEQLCRDFQLCAKYCHLQERVSSCSHYRLTTCEGICRNTEPVAQYNAKVGAAIKYMTANTEDLLIREKGRENGEDAVILMKSGMYYGYGYIAKDMEIDSIEDVLAFLQPQKNTVEAQRLLQSYLLKNGMNGAIRKEVAIDNKQ